MKIFTWTCKIASFCVLDFYLREAFDTGLTVTISLAILVTVWSVCTYLEWRERT